ncbi:MAG: transcriptional repressor LexA [Acidobacteriota bacterium]
MLPTPRQLQVYEFLRSYIRRHGCAPTYEEIRHHFGFRSYNAVQKHLRALAERGALRSPWKGRKRALTLVEPPPHALAQAAAGAPPDRLGRARARVVRHAARDEESTLVPGGVPVSLLGEVAAGRPLEPLEHPESIEIPPSLLRGGENFALRVRGDSLVEDGIHDGDIVIVRRQVSAENGQTVVALVDGEATIKKYYRHGCNIELRPAHPEMRSILVDEDEVRIRGVVVGLIRRFQFV